MDSKKLIFIIILIVQLWTGGILRLPYALAETPSASNNLDLTSTQKDISAADLFHGSSQQSISITTGGNSQEINPSDMLTPAQYLAASQVLATGQQSLVLSALGNASGGAFVLSGNSSNNLSGLVIPNGVTAIHDFAQSAILNVSGDIINSGNLYGISSNTAITSGTISSLNITNTIGANISTAVSPTLLSSLISGINPAVSALNLNLIAANNITNAGSIISSANLNLIAGGSITNALPAGLSGASPIMQAFNNLNMTTNNIVNSGVMSAMNNINIASQINSDLVINNIGGKLESITGLINVRDSLFSSKNHLVLWGGDIFANETNLFSGTGIVRMNVNEVMGTVNVYAGEAHFQSNTENLQLGVIDLSGDPTFYNTSGNVTINSALNFSGQNLAIVASGDVITAAGAGAINTSSGSGNGGAITIIAGASFTSDGPGSVLPPPPGDTTSTLTITGASATGGRIDLTVGPGISSLTSRSTGGGGNGGDITLIAFEGSSATSGRILLPTGFTILAGGNGSGTNGNILMIGSESSINADAITIGAVTTSGGAAGTGNITMATAVPTLPGGSVTITDGAITSGTFGVGTINAARILTGAITGAGGTIDLTAGNNFEIGGNIRNNGASSANGGTVNLTSGSTTILRIGIAATNYVNGDIRVSATGSAGSGGTINISTTGNFRLEATTDFQANAIDGNGGTINVTAGGSIRLPTGTISVNAAGSGDYIGGTINFTSTGDEIFITGTNGALSLNANGTNAGSGGTITMNAADTIRFGAGDRLITQADGGATGNGGTVNIASAGATADLTFNSGVQRTVEVIARGGATSGNGGNLIVNNGRSITVTTTAAIDLSVQGSTGNYGSLDMTTGMAAAGTLDISGNLNYNGVGSGNGGSITLEQQNGTLALAGLTSMNVNGGATNGNGGNISITVPNWPALGFNLALNSNAAGTGNGGNITVTTTSTTGDFTIGGAAGQIAVSATGGSGASASGNGGVITLNSGRSLTVNTANIDLRALGTNGTYGILDMTSSLQASGTLSITGTLDYNGVGTGDGGQVIIDMSQGSLSLAGLTAINAIGGSNNGNGGSISINLPNIPALAFNLVLNSSGSGTGNGGAVSITTTSSTGDITIGTNAGEIQAFATGGSASSAAGNGGSLTISAGRNLTVAGLSFLAYPLGDNGNGATISLTAGTQSTGNLIVSSFILAHGVGTGSGGTLTMSMNDPTGNIGFLSAIAAAIKGTSSSVNGSADISIAGTGAGLIFVDGSSTILADNINITTTSLIDNGSILSTASDGSITIQSNGALTLSGTPSPITVAGTSQSAYVSVIANGANPLTVSSSYTFDAGTNGIVTLSAEASGGSIEIAASTTVTITNSIYIGVFAPQVTLNDGSAITASGSGQYIEVGSGTLSQTVTLPSSGTANITASNGGSVYIGPYNSSDLTISPSGGNPSTLQVDAAYLYLYSNGNLTINNNVSIQTNGEAWVESDGGTITFNGNALLQATGSNSWIYLNAWSGDLTINGTATAISTTGGVNTGVNLGAAGTIFINSDLTIDVGSGGSAGYLNIAGTLLDIADGVTLSSTGGIALPVGGILLGNGSVLHSDVTTGSAIGNPAGLQTFSITGTNGGTGTISTGGGSINLWSYGTMTFDKVSGSTTLNFSGGTLNVTSNNGATTIRSGVTLNSTNDINFNVNTGSVEASGQLNTTSSGSITLSAATGILSIGSNAMFFANEGNIIIQNVDTSGGSIEIGSGSDIHAYTFSNPSFGNVTIVIGIVPDTPTVGTPPANVTVNEVGGGVVYFGAQGITANAPTNTLNAIARNIIFDTNGAASSAIVLEGNVTITADPPIALAQEQVTPNTSTENFLDLPLLNTERYNQVISTLIYTDLTTPVQPGVFSGVYNQQFFEPANSGVSDKNSAPDNHAQISEESVLKPISFQQTNPANPPICLSGTIQDIEAEPASNLVRVSKNTLIDFKDKDNLTLLSGEILVCPQDDLEITCGQYKVIIEKNCLALVSKKNRIICVTNLLDTLSGSIRVKAGNKCHKLSIGKEMIISNETKHISKKFHSDNIGRRHIKHFYEQKVKIVTSEISHISLMQNNNLLQSLISAPSTKTDARLKENLLKATACLMVVTNSHGAYESAMTSTNHRNHN